jgi:hypothetical protein
VKNQKAPAMLLTGCLPPLLLLQLVQALAGQQVRHACCCYCCCG